MPSPRVPTPRSSPRSTPAALSRIWPIRRIPPRSRAKRASSSRDSLNCETTAAHNRGAGFLRCLGPDRKPHGETRQFRSHRDRADAELGLGLAGESAHALQPRVLRSSGKPYNPERKIIAWNGTAWGGADVPDFKADENPAGGMGPFIMNPEGVARFFARAAMAEGPFPEHYEPFETPLGYNPLNPNQPQATNNPAARVFPDDREDFGKAAEFPHVATTYRLTEQFPLLDQARAPELHHSAGTVRRNRRSARGGDGHRHRGARSR